MTATAPIAAEPSRPFPNPAQTFPQLTPEQISRVAAQGRLRAVERGEVLVDEGMPAPACFGVRREGRSGTPGRPGRDHRDGAHGRRVHGGGGDARRPASLSTLRAREPAR